MFIPRCGRHTTHNLYKAIVLGFTFFVCFQMLELMASVSVTPNYIYVTAKNTDPPVLPFKEFKYPLDVDMPKLVKEYKEKNGDIGVQPINIFPYKFLTEIPDKCKTGDEINLILIVKSAVMNFRRRFAIRETWGNEQVLKDIKFKTVFLLGNPQDIPTKMLIKHEIRQNGDIIQIDYIDSYYNNTIKSTGAISWATRHCSNAKFLMIADDDFYVATDFLVKKLNSFPKAKHKELFLGRAWYHEIPQRGKHQKWYIPVSVWPYEDYPPFVSAGASIMSMEVAVDINIAIKFTKKYKFDDVFIGIVLYKLGIKPIHSDRIRISRKANVRDKRFHTILASHCFGDADELRAAWELHRQYVANQTAVGRALLSFRKRSHMVLTRDQK